jgi:hypothetical protein
MWSVGEVRFFRSAGVRGSPGLLVLLAFGWVIEAVDDRYGSVLLSLPVCSVMSLRRERS